MNIDGLLFVESDPPAYFYYNQHRSSRFYSVKGPPTKGNIGKPNPHYAHTNNKYTYFKWTQNNFDMYLSGRDFFLCNRNKLHLQLMEILNKYIVMKTRWCWRGVIQNFIAN